ncbi:MAG TPA: outer membrane lipoprotein carrier protein LolA [Candidatus Angelobacter sp.]
MSQLQRLLGLRESSRFLFILVLLAGVAAGWPCVPSAAQSGDDLNSVLAKMNATAGKFKSAEADVEFETYQKVIDEKDLQKGRIYFRRTGKGVEAAIDLTSPAPKQVVYKDEKVSIYDKKIDQVTERDVSKYKGQVEAFLSLGIGASGDDLKRSYEVTLAGWETVQGVKTAKLALVPKDEKTRNTYNKIMLWLDPDRSIALQQQFFEPSGDYRVVRYSDMKLNSKISDDVFRLKTTGHTKLVRP